MAIDLCTAAYADGVRFDFACGDEVYGNCTALREFFEQHQQAYVLRVASTFMLTLNAQTWLTCAKAVELLATDTRRWEVRSAGTGSKGHRWYAWAWIATASPRHHLLVRRHLRSGELAFHYCYVPAGPTLTKARLVRAAGLRWPVEEDFEFAKGCLGLDQRQARLHTAIARHTVLVMTALAVCAVAAAQLKHRTDTQAPPPNTPDQPSPAEPGMIPLTIPETKRLLAAVGPPFGHARHHRQDRLRRDPSLTEALTLAIIYLPAHRSRDRPTVKHYSGPFTALLLTVATPVAAIWLIPDQTNDAAKQLAAQGVDLDYGIEPLSFGPVADTVIGVGACAVVVACLALLASGAARRTIAPAWWWVAASILAIGFFLGFGWRVWTAGGIGANIGAGLVVLMSPVCIGLGSLPGIFGAVFLNRARKQRRTSASVGETAS